MSSRSTRRAADEEIAAAIAQAEGSGDSSTGAAQVKKEGASASKKRKSKTTRASDVHGKQKNSTEEEAFPVLTMEYLVGRLQLLDEIISPQNGIGLLALSSQNSLLQETLKEVRDTQLALKAIVCVLALVGFQGSGKSQLGNCMLVHPDSLGPHLHAWGQLPLLTATGSTGVTEVPIYAAYGQEMALYITVNRADASPVLVDALPFARRSFDNFRQQQRASGAAAAAASGSSPADLFYNDLLVFKHAQLYMRDILDAINLALQQHPANVNQYVQDASGLVPLLPPIIATGASNGGAAAAAPAAAGVALAPTHAAAAAAVTRVTVGAAAVGSPAAGASLTGSAASSSASRSPPAVGGKGIAHVHEKDIREMTLQHRWATGSKFKLCDLPGWTRSGGAARGVVYPQLRDADVYMMVAPRGITQLEFDALLTYGGFSDPNRSPLFISCHLPDTEEVLQARRKTHAQVEEENRDKFVKICSVCRDNEAILPQFLTWLDRSKFFETLQKNVIFQTIPLNKIELIHAPRPPNTHVAAAAAASAGSSAAASSVRHSAVAVTDSCRTFAELKDLVYQRFTESSLEHLTRVLGHFIYVSHVLLNTSKQKGGKKVLGDTFWHATSHLIKKLDDQQMKELVTSKLPDLPSKIDNILACASLGDRDPAPAFSFIHSNLANLLVVALDVLKTIFFNSPLRVGVDKYCQKVTTDMPQLLPQQMDDEHVNLLTMRGEESDGGRAASKRQREWAIKLQRNSAERKEMETRCKRVYQECRTRTVAELGEPTPPPLQNAAGEIDETADLGEYQAALARFERHLRLRFIKKLTVEMLDWLLVPLVKEWNDDLAAAFTSVRRVLRDVQQPLAANIEASVKDLVDRLVHLREQLRKAIRNDVYVQNEDREQFAVSLSNIPKPELLLKDATAVLKEGKDGPLQPIRFNKRSLAPLKVEIEPATPAASAAAAAAPSGAAAAGGADGIGASLAVITMRGRGASLTARMPASVRTAILQFSARFKHVLFGIHNSGEQKALFPIMTFVSFESGPQILSFGRRDFANYQHLLFYFVWEKEKDQLLRALPQAIEASSAAAAAAPAEDAPRHRQIVVVMQNESSAAMALDAAKAIADHFDFEFAWRLGANVVSTSELLPVSIATRKCDNIGITLYRLQSCVLQYFEHIKRQLAKLLSSMQADLSRQVMAQLVSPGCLQANKDRLVQVFGEATNLIQLLNNDAERKRLSSSRLEPLMELFEILQPAAARAASAGAASQVAETSAELFSSLMAAWTRFAMATIPPAQPLLQRVLPKYPRLHQVLKTTQQCRHVVLDNIRAQRGVRFEARPIGRPTAAAAASGAAAAAAPVHVLTIGEALEEAEQNYGMKFRESHFIALIMSFGFKEDPNTRPPLYANSKTKKRKAAAAAAAGSAKHAEEAAALPAAAPPRNTKRRKAASVSGSAAAAAAAAAAGAAASSTSAVARPASASRARSCAKPKWDEISMDESP